MLVQCTWHPNFFLQLKTNELQCIAIISYGQEFSKPLFSCIFSFIFGDIKCSLDSWQYPCVCNAFLSSKIACILKWYLQRRLCWWRRSNLKIPKQFSLKVALELTKWANKNSRFLWNVKHCQLFGGGNYFFIFQN